MELSAVRAPGKRRGYSRPLLFKVRERGIEWLLLLCAVASIFTTFGIVGVLAVETYQFFREVALLDFLTDTQWTPLFTEKHYGILPLLNGTLLVAGGAMLVALPLGLLSSIYLSE